MDAQQFATAYALATSIGIRAFVTLALASLAMHFGYLHPASSFAWLGSDGATIVLGILAVLELAGDKIPVVDHFMHAIHFATKPIAAAVLVGSMVPEDGNTLSAGTYALMGAGALDALGVHTASAAIRATSTVTTAGIANPFVSIIEDVVAVVMIALSIFLPVLAAIGAVALTIVILLLARRVYRATRRRSAAIT